jgi:hypothetical protein
MVVRILGMLATMRAIDAGTTIRRVGEKGTGAMAMKSRKLSGDELDSALGSRKPSGLDYSPYLEVLDQYNEGDVVAVEVNGSDRGEKIRFSRAAKIRNKSLLWLLPSSANEIVFEIQTERQPRQRGRRNNGGQ